MSDLNTTTQLVLVVLSNSESASWGMFTFISLVQWIRSKGKKDNLGEYRLLRSSPAVHRCSSLLKYSTHQYGRREIYQWNIVTLMELKPSVQWQKVNCIYLHHQLTLRFALSKIEALSLPVSVFLPLLWQDTWISLIFELWDLVWNLNMSATFSTPDASYDSDQTVTIEIF